MAVISFALPADDAHRFARIAEGQGGKSALLRRLVAAVIGQQGDAAIAVAPRKMAASHRIELLFTDDEVEAIEQAATAKGLRRTSWLTALVRRRIAMRPQPAEPDAKALEAIRSELRRIGVGLATLAEGRHGGPETAMVVEKAKHEVQLLVRAVGAARRGDLAYWDTPE